jgi:hypothetical protein
MPVRDIRGTPQLFAHERQSGEVFVNRILETHVSQCAGHDLRDSPELKPGGGQRSYCSACNDSEAVCRATQRHNHALSGRKKC